MSLQDITLIIGTTIGLFGFFRALGQNKEKRFHEITLQLSNKDSAMLRAAAAAELSKYFYYRTYVIFGRLFKSQSISMALHGLKIENEEKFVRQELVECVQNMFRDIDYKKFPRVNMVGSQLYHLIMHHFDFRSVDLTESCLDESDLGGAQFQNSKLWRCTFRNTKLGGANFNNAEIWDTDFSFARLDNASIIMDDVKHVNEHTYLINARFKNTTVSRNVVEMCGLNDIEGIVIVN